MGDNRMKGDDNVVIEAASEHERPMENDRREFLEKYGKLAIYTPPAIMALMFYGQRSARADSSFPKNPFRWNKNTSGSKRRLA